jgi:hypothetical protein
MGRTLGNTLSADGLFTIIGATLFLQSLFGFYGWVFLKHHGFLGDLVQGKHYSMGLYAVFFPVISLVFLYGQFVGGLLIPSTSLSPYSLFHWLWLMPLFAAHLWSIRYFFRLNKKLFSAASVKRGDKPAASPK